MRREEAETDSPREETVSERSERPAVDRAGSWGVRCPEPVAIRGPGYSIDPHADGNERADDVITVLGPDGTLVHRPLHQQDGTEWSQS